MIRCLSIACTAALLAAQDKPKDTYGKLDKSETWSGEIHMVGDVVVPKGMMLTIVPGTRIRIAGTDKRPIAECFRGSKVELHVMGVLRIQGTEEKPVIFEPDEKEVESGDFWHGVVIRQEKDAKTHSTFTSARFHNAFAAIQVPSGGPRIVDCAFFDCTIGVEVGSCYSTSSTHPVLKTGPASPLVRRSRFADCKTGVYCERQGSPDVRNCAFYQCQTALGNSRPGVTGSLQDPGAIVERCAFISNGRGVMGQAFVRDSIFHGNQTAVRMSRFHSVYSSNIDHLAMRSNLFHQNGSDIEGDTGLDNNPITGDPMFAGPLSDLGEPGKALPPCLKLGASSPARKRARDGGDLGPLSIAMGRMDEAKWEPAGTIVGEVFALPFEEGVDSRSVIRARPSAGKRSGKNWWVRPVPGDSGEFDLADVFGIKSKVGWIAFSARASKAGAVKLEINGDVHRVGVFVNGQPANQAVARRRRFGVRGADVEVKVKSGANTFVLKVESWSRRPRFGVSVPSGMSPKKAPKPKTAALKISSGRLVKKRDDRYLEFVMSAPLSWSDNRKLGLFTILDESGEKVPDQERLDVLVITQKKLRLSNVPANWKKPLVVVLNGLRSPKGEVYGKTPAFTVK